MAVWWLVLSLPWWQCVYNGFMSAKALNCSSGQYHNEIGRLPCASLLSWSCEVLSPSPQADWSSSCMVSWVQVCETTCLQCCSVWGNWELWRNIMNGIGLLHRMLAQWNFPPPPPPLTEVSSLQVLYTALGNWEPDTMDCVYWMAPYIWSWSPSCHPHWVQYVGP